MLTEKSVMGAEPERLQLTRARTVRESGTPAAAVCGPPIYTASRGIGHEMTWNRKKKSRGLMNSESQTAWLSFLIHCEKKTMPIVTEPD